MVVAHHIALTSPKFEGVYIAGFDSPARGFTWLMTFTPLHFFWAGTEAVFLFFVLSGFVLALPFLRPNRPRWLSYYPKRLIRLYLPVWASLALALLLAGLWPRESVAGFTFWVNDHAAPQTLWQDAYLLDGAKWLNSPLWSLRWEVMFSLLLPAYVLLAAEFKRYWIFGVVGSLLIIRMGLQTGDLFMQYLPMFGIGVCLAAGKDTLKALATKIPTVLWSILVLIGIAIFPASWYMPGFIYAPIIELLGCIILIFACLYFRPVVAVGSSPIFHWLGTRSFSLYLVHEPIILSIVNGTHLTNPLQVAAIAIPTSGIAAELFYRFVEKPSHRLANFVGKRLQRSPRRRLEPSPTPETVN